MRNCKFNPKNKEIVCEAATNVEDNNIVQPEIEPQQTVITIENEKHVANKKIRHKK